MRSANPLQGSGCYGTPLEVVVVAIVVSTYESVASNVKVVTGVAKARKTVPRTDVAIRRSSGVCRESPPIRQERGAP